MKTILPAYHIEPFVPFCSQSFWMTIGEQAYNFERLCWNCPHSWANLGPGEGRSCIEGVGAIAATWIDRLFLCLSLLFRLDCAFKAISSRPQHFQKRDELEAPKTGGTYVIWDMLTSSFIECSTLRFCFDYVGESVLMADSDSRQCIIADLRHTILPSMDFFGWNFHVRMVCKPRAQVFSNLAVLKIADQFLQMSDCCFKTCLLS